MLGHHFDDFSSLALDGHTLDTAGCGLWAGLRGAVAFLALNDESVRDKICKDVAVHAMRCASVKGLAGDAGTSVQRARREKVHIGGDDDIVTGVKVGVLLVTDIISEHVDFDSWVELLDLGRSCLCTLWGVSVGPVYSVGEMSTYIRAYMSISEEELGAQVFFCDDFMVGQCNRADASENEILRNFVGKGFDGDEKDVGCADPVGVLGACASKVVVTAYFSCAWTPHRRIWRS